MEEIKEINPNEGIVDEAWDYGDEYAFGNLDFVIPTITHNIWPKTNQAWLKETVSACTIVGSLNQLIRLFGIDMDMKASNELSKEVVNYCTKYGYVVGYGRSTPTAINVVCKWRNEVGAKRFNKEEVFYVRLDYTDKKLKEAMDKGHLVGFTYALNFGEDRKKGRVYKESYPGATGHRTNRKAPKYTTATGGAKNEGAEVGVHDSYYSRTNEYYIKDRKPYMNKGMNTPGYLILTKSAMGKTVEEVKEEIKEEKAVNALIGALSTVWGELPENFQKKVSELASELRVAYPNARKLVDDEANKHYQVVADTLSYNWKWADEKHQEAYALLAKELREKFNLK